MGRGPAGADRGERNGTPLSPAHAVTIRLPTPMRPRRAGERQGPEPHGLGGRRELDRLSGASPPGPGRRGPGDRADAVALDIAPARILLADLRPDRLERVLLAACEAQPLDYGPALRPRGIGAQGLRALSLVAELMCGGPASVRDPCPIRRARGGKDGTAFRPRGSGPPRRDLRVASPSAFGGEGRRTEKVEACGDWLGWGARVEPGSRRCRRAPTLRLSERSPSRTPRRSPRGSRRSRPGCRPGRSSSRPWRLGPKAGPTRRRRAPPRGGGSSAAPVPGSPCQPPIRGFRHPGWPTR